MTVTPADESQAIQNSMDVTQFRRFWLEEDARTIYVWIVSIEAPNELVEQFHRFLSADERERALRFRFEHLRRSFILARGALRIILARYLKTRPEDIRFHYGSNGKPYVDAGPGFHFNASHSGSFALFGFTIGCELGIDIEQIRPLADMTELATRCFCIEESRELASIPLLHRERGFFTCWTRKEAYLKATGDGLSVSLDSFCVTVDPFERARLVNINGDTQAAEAWTIQDIPLSAEYVAALAHRDTVRAIRLISIDDPSRLIDICD